MQQVTVTNYAVKQRKDGTTFITLELTGSLEIVQSDSGKYYLTVRKCNIPSTFEEPIAKLMIGEKLEGDIIRVAAEPYEYLNKRTGEVMLLTHTYAYSPKGSLELIGNTPVQEMQTAG